MISSTMILGTEDVVKLSNKVQAQVGEVGRSVLHLIIGIVDVQLAVVNGCENDVTHARLIRVEAVGLGWALV